MRKRISRLLAQLALGGLLALSAPVTAEAEGLGQKILLYLPNRVLDALDMVRARARLGPGAAVGVRLTEPLRVYLGAYGTVFVGLPGPRMDAVPPIPAGLESLNGAQLSVLDATFNVAQDPDYSPTEIGASVHLLLVGADVGIDPVEIADFFAGFLLFDLRGDDF